MPEANPPLLVLKYWVHLYIIRLVLPDVLHLMLDFHKISISIMLMICLGKLLHGSGRYVVLKQGHKCVVVILNNASE